MRRTWNGLMGLAVFAVALGSCGDGADVVEGPDPVVAPFVGTWDAEVFTVTSEAQPPIVADLLENGSFNVNIQPSGLYTATLVFGGLDPIVEIGQLIVSSGFVTFRPNGPNPCPGSSTFTFVRADYLALTGRTCFDFNLDDEPEDAEAHIELQRR